MSSQVVSVSVGKKIPDIKIRMTKHGDKNKLNESTSNKFNMNAINLNNATSNHEAGNYHLANKTFTKRLPLNPSMAGRGAGSRPTQNTTNRDSQNAKPVELRKVHREVIVTNAKGVAPGLAGTKPTRNSASADNVSRISLLAKPKLRVQVCVNSPTANANKNTTLRRNIPSAGGASALPSRLPISKPLASLSTSPSQTNRSKLLPAVPASKATNNTSASRVWNRKIPPQTRHSKQTVTRSSSTASSHKASSEISTQTNEAEILNNCLLVGDIRYMTPSPSLIVEIEKQRQVEKNKQLLKATRKFEEHSLKQEEHLDNWNEFLEHGFITKKKLKTKDYFEENKKLISSMDQILNRSIPKTESISNIRARIKHKEMELLSLFDNVQSKYKYI